MVCPKQAPLSKTKKPAKPGRPSQSKTKELVVPTLNKQSPFGETSDLLDDLPLNACVEFTHRIFTSVRTLPSGPAHSQAVLKTIVPFVAEYGSTA